MSPCPLENRKSMTEQELAEGCKRQDNEARKALYEAFAGSLLSLCLRYMGTRDEAEDVLHDGFLKAYTRIEGFTWRGEGSLGAWLRRLFTNCALDRLEEDKRMATGHDEDIPDLADDEAEAPPTVSAEVIMHLMGELPAGYRTVLNLFLVEGWSHREIAARLGITESTSGSQYLRARALLRQKIQKYIQTHDA